MAIASALTREIYRCKACAAWTPSPGRLEGNWCPACRKVGTLELALEDEALALADAAGGAPPRGRAREAAEGFAPLVEAALAGLEGPRRADLERLRDPEALRVLLFLEEEDGSAPLLDVFRACRFATKTHALRRLLLLRQAGLVEAHEEERWVLTKRARDAIEAVRAAAEGA